MKTNGAPQEEAFGSDSVNYVAAPWDVFIAYYFRAVESAEAIPEASRVAWLERTDVAERAVWVSTLRDGEATLGVVIKQTMDRRGAHWDPPAGRDAGHTGFAKGLGKRDKQGELPSSQLQSPMQMSLIQQH